MSRVPQLNLGILNASNSSAAPASSRTKKLVSFFESIAAPPAPVPESQALASKRISTTYSLSPVADVVPAAEAAALVEEQPDPLKDLILSFKNRAPASPETGRRSFAMSPRGSHRHRDVFLKTINEFLKEKDGEGQTKRRGNYSLIRGHQGWEWVQVRPSASPSSDAVEAFTRVLKELERCDAEKITYIDETQFVPFDGRIVEETARISCCEVIQRFLQNPTAQKILSNPKYQELRQRTLQIFKIALTDGPKADATAMQEFLLASEGSMAQLIRFVGSSQKAGLAKDATLAQLGLGSIFGGLEPEEQTAVLEQMRREPEVVRIYNTRSVCRADESLADAKRDVQGYLEAVQALESDPAALLTTEAAQRSYEAHDYGVCVREMLKREALAFTNTNDTLLATVMQLGKLTLHHLKAQGKIEPTLEAFLKAQFSKYASAENRPPVEWRDFIEVFATLSLLAKRTKIKDY